MSLSVPSAPAKQTVEAQDGPSAATLVHDVHPPFERRHLLWLLAFTLLAAVLRLWDLGTWALWVDEAHTYRDIVSSWDSFWNSKVSRYPLPYLLLRATSTVLPDSEWGLRLPFAFFGIASIPAIALVARSMIGRHAALLAALFLAASPWHIYWSQNARGYAMVLFFGVLALGALYQGHQRRSLRMLAVGLPCAALAGFSHPHGFLLLGAIFAYTVLDTWIRQRGGYRTSRWYPLVILCVLAALTPLMVSLLQHFAKVKEPEFSLIHLAQTTAFFVGVPVLVAAAGGALWLFDRGDRAVVFLSSCCVLPLLALSVLSVWSNKVTAQYAFVTLPAIHMLAAALVVAFVERFQGGGFRTWVLRAMPVGILVFHMLGQDVLYFAKQHGGRPRWREAVEFVERHCRRQGTGPCRILTTNGPSVDYYLRRHHGGVIPAKIRVERMEMWELGEASETYLSKQMKLAKDRGEEFYVVVNPPVLEEMDVERRADSFLRGHLNQIRQYRNWWGPKDLMVLVYWWQR